MGYIVCTLAIAIGVLLIIFRKQISKWTIWNINLWKFYGDSYRKVQIAAAQPAIVTLVGVMVIILAAVFLLLGMMGVIKFD
jgi:hypothetical protein